MSKHANNESRVQLEQVTRDSEIIPFLGKTLANGNATRDNAPQAEAVWKMKPEKRENSGLSGHKLDRVYLRIREVAEYIRVSRPTIYSWINKGVLPFKYYLIENSCVKHRAYRFLKSDVDAWMDSNQKIPAGLEYALNS